MKESLQPRSRPGLSFQDIPVSVTPDIGGARMDDKPENWLTYDEAAERLGIKPDSVRRRAAARKWPRRRGNDGRARVRIPDDALPPDVPPDVRGDVTPALTPDASAELNAARVELATLRAELAGVRDRLTDTQADRDRLTALLETALQPRPGLLERLAQLVRG
jgi:hypothetical protein